MRGQVGLIPMVGLVMFVFGIICLLVWGGNMEGHSGWFFPGLLLTGGGVVLLWLSGRAGGSS